MHMPCWYPPGRESLQAALVGGTTRHLRDAALGRLRRNAMEQVFREQARVRGDERGSVPCRSARRIGTLTGLTRVGDTQVLVAEGISQHVSLSPREFSRRSSSTRDQKLMGATPPSQAGQLLIMAVSREDDGTFGKDTAKIIRATSQASGSGCYLLTPVSRICGV